MGKATFVYVTYIAASDEAVWKAIVDPGIAPLYWGHVNASDWKVGSRWEHRVASKDGQVRLVGRVVEVVPHSRLVITWAFPEDATNEKKHSRVTFHIEPLGKVVRLTVTHEDLEPESTMLEGITEGWPKVLASMKSYLELGSVRFTAVELDR